MALGLRSAPAACVIGLCFAYESHAAALAFSACSASSQLLPLLRNACLLTQQ